MSGAGQVRTTLLENLKELHLPAMRAGFEETARRAEKETLSYEQYLLELSVRECEQRRGNRMRRRLQDSGLPLEKSLENFDLKRMPTRVSRQLKVLLEGGFLDRKETGCLWDSGSGQESLVVCDCAGVDCDARPENQIHDLCPARAGPPRGKARTAVASGNQATGEVRGPDYRSDGVRAAKSRGDGGRVHTVGGAL